MGVRRSEAYLPYNIQLFRVYTPKEDGSKLTICKIGGLKA